MKIMNKLFLFLARRNLLNHLNDKTYIKMFFEANMNKKLDLNNPKTYNEKLQWLKLYDRKEEYTTMVDKYEAKEYVGKIIGKEYIVPTIGVYDKFDEIDFDKLPDKFVIKCTHDSGGIVICKNKEEFDLISAKKKIEKCLKSNYYYLGREWPYKNVHPKIIIEKYLGNNSNRDYKFFCFNGEPKIMYVSDNSHTKDQCVAFFDMDYKNLNIKRKDYRDYKKLPKKPKNFEKMKELASLLSNGIPHLRVDFYEVNSNLYFGELTFTTCSGILPFEDEKWDYELGDMIQLPKK